jgi:hypothetical protein
MDQLEIEKSEIEIQRKEMLEDDKMKKERKVVSIQCWARRYLAYKVIS